MDFKIFFEEFQDFLAPKLDAYEQAIYLFIFRHSRLLGLPETTIGFKSARFKIALGFHFKATPMAESTCYDKLKSLERKGCIKVIGTVQGGTRIQLYLPSEIPGIIPPEQHSAILDLEHMDFFNVPENRLLIFRRENERCFYCLRTLDATNYVIEHVVSRPNGDNTYRNVVAACMSCNNKKGKVPAENFLRNLYRNNYLSAEDFDDRMSAVQLLQDGKLKPNIHEMA